MMVPCWDSPIWELICIVIIPGPNLIEYRIPRFGRWPCKALKGSQQKGEAPIKCDSYWAFPDKEIRFLSSQSTLPLNVAKRKAFRVLSSLYNWFTKLSDNEIFESDETYLSLSRAWPSFHNYHEFLCLQWQDMICTKVHECPCHELHARFIDSMDAINAVPLLTLCLSEKKKSMRDRGWDSRSRWAKRGRTDRIKPKTTRSSFGLLCRWRKFDPWWGRQSIWLVTRSDQSMWTVLRLMERRGQVKKGSFKFPSAQNLFGLTLFMHQLQL